MGASAAKLLVYYHPDAPNAADQERLVADVAADCRAADLALFVEPLSFSIVEGEPLDRRGAAPGRRRDGAPAHGDRRRHPQGRVPLRRRRSRIAAAGARRARSSTGRRRCRGCSCRAASTTRPSRPRSRPPAGPARAGSSSVAPSGRRPRRSSRRPATPSSRPPAASGSAGWPISSTSAGRPWHDRPSRLTSAPMPGDGWYRDY